MSYKLGLDHPPNTQVNDMTGQKAAVKSSFNSPVALPFATMVPQTIDTDIIVPANHKALMAEGHAVGDGITLIVEDGASLSIV